jgi:hypothetical protein
MDKPDFSFSLPSEKAEHLRELLKQRADQGAATSIFPAGQMEWLDMSSSELHINNECPFCHVEWMDKVKPSGNCPICNRQYSMETMESGQISIGWSITAEEGEKMKGGII